METNRRAVLNMLGLRCLFVYRPVSGDDSWATEYTSLSEESCVDPSCLFCGLHYKVVI